MLWLLPRRRMRIILPQFIRPPRIDLDARSLALFRILLGVYLVVETLYARLGLGKYDLAWYTSDENDDNSSTPRSYLAATDTPHRSPLHQVWFYRGSASVQLALFGMTAVTAACFAVGYSGNNGNRGAAWLKTLLFVLVTAQQNRNMHVHDGSDNYCRHLLLWSIFLPLFDVWSIDAWLLPKRRLSSSSSISTAQPSGDAVATTTTAASSTVSTTRIVVSTLPAYAISLQIVLMYAGTVWARTFDRYPTFGALYKDCDWLPPQLSAIHYALSSSFAVRDDFVGNVLVRRHVWLGQAMTLSAMLIEGLCPLLCWYSGPRHRMYFVLPLWALHGALLFHMRLPQWQYLALLSHAIWIPSHVWERLLQQWRRLCNRTWQKTESQSKTATANVSEYKKTDGDTATVPTSRSDAMASNANTGTISNGSTRQLHVLRRLPSRSGVVSKSIQCFLAFYMVYNFAGERRWIRKHDHGDIGEGLRLSQYWVMYATAPKTAHNTMLTGILPSGINKKSKKDSRRIDLLHFISTRGRQVVDAPHQQNGAPILDMSRRYPSARWERALHEWASRSMTTPDYSRQRAKHFMRALCTLVNDDLYAQRRDSIIAMEMVFTHLIVNPPASSKQRYATQRAAVDTIVKVSCEPWPSPRQTEAP